MLLAIAITLALILILLIGIAMIGVKVTIIHNDNTNKEDTITNYDEEFIVLGDVYIQIIHIQSIFVNKNDKSIEIKTDVNRYFYRYVDAKEFNEALKQFDWALNTKMQYYDGI